MKIEIFTKQQIAQHLAAGGLIDVIKDKVEPFVSVAQNSIPGAGSATADLSKLDQELLFLNQQAIVMHNTGDFTIKSSVGNVRFWIREDYRQLWIAHHTKKAVMNRMIDKKYHCGDLY